MFRLPLLSALSLASLAAQPVLVPFATQLDRPTHIAQPSTDGAKLWVLEKAGTIRRIDPATGDLSPSPLLNLRSQIEIRMNEQGLLGLAFDPDFASKQRFYLYYTDRQGDSCLSRFTLKSSPEATKASEEVLLRFPQDFRNHNGGFLEVGPDDYLYLGTGDGGAGNDPKNRAQNLNSYLGKILRIDIRTDQGYQIPSDNPFRAQAGAKPEIFAYGLRNPWRCAFDPPSGYFFIADVGQNHWEEINALPLAELKGANFGWRLREGLVPTPKNGVGGPAPRGAIDPVYVYKHGSASNEGLSVTGGLVYRGPVKAFQGQYFFADYVHPHIWTLSPGSKPNQFQFKDLTATLKSSGQAIRQIASFGQDQEKNLYLVDHSGTIFKLVDR